MKKSWRLSVVDETLRVTWWMVRIGSYDEKINWMGLEGEVYVWLIEGQKCTPG